MNEAVLNSVSFQPDKEIKELKGGREHRKLISRPRDFPPNSRIFRVAWYVSVVTAYPSK